MDLPYYTKSEGTGGRIKEKPSDFIVKEIPLYNPEGEGQHLYINITKEKRTSKEIQKILAKNFELPRNAVSMAGLKDKQAITTQTFSVDIGNSPVKGKKEGIIDKIDNMENITINWDKRHKNKLKKGHSLGNRFEIIISNTNKIEKAKKVVKEIKEKGLPNFYGQQRFSKGDTNIRDAEDILKGKNTGNRWLKNFILSSYQSYLFNKYIIFRINKGKFEELIKGDIAKKYDTGGLFIVKDKEKEQERFDNKKISFTGPIYGEEMWWPEDKSREMEEELMERFIKKDKLKKLGRGSRRLGKILVNDLKVEKHKRGILAKFSLPKGSYATVVLREIMKSDKSE